MKTIVIDTLGAIHIDAVRSESGTATIDLVVHVRSGLREVHPRPARPSAIRSTEGSTAFIVTPAPARRLACQPTHRAKYDAKNDDIGEISTEVCAGWKEE